MGSGLRLIEEAWSLRLSRFVLIGMASTVLYAVLAFTFTRMEGVGTTGASILAFALAAVFSYAGHKYVTFVSGDAHRLELPRFLALTAIGLAVVSLLPAILSGLFSFPTAVPILLACVVVPALNYIVLGNWVFRGR
jgi:putative flippase GtrA